MSRRRAKANQNQRATQSSRPSLKISIEMKSDGSIVTDPQYNKAAIEHIDYLYTLADREDYDVEWTSDHKLAFLIADIMDGVLAQWEPPIDQAEVDASVAGVPHLNESPVRDVYDLNDMEPANRAKRRKLN